MFKAIVGVIVGLFVMTSGAPSQRSARKISFETRNIEAPQHLDVVREFYVFPAFLRGKFAKRKVGYLVFSNHEIDKPRFLSLKDKRYDEALALIQVSGVYRGAPAERAFSPLFDSSVYRKPSFTIRRGIIIPKTEEKNLQRKTEDDELHSTDDNFESSLIQRLQELKKESQSRSSGTSRQQEQEKPSQAETNTDFQKLSAANSAHSLTHMAFESDVGFDVELEGFVNNESVIQNGQDSHINANDDQRSSGIFRSDSGNSNKFSHISTGVNADSSIRTDIDHFQHASFTNKGNDQDISESFSTSIQQKSENEIKLPSSADDDTTASAGSSTIDFPFSSLHLSTDEIVQAILALSDTINVENLQDDSPRIPFRIFDGKLIANRHGNSASTFNNDADTVSSILTVPYTKSESLLLINQGRSMQNSKPIYIKTYILRFGHKNRHAETGDLETSGSSSNSEPSAVILGFRDAVNHGLADGISEVLSVKLVEDDDEMRENVRNKRHIFSFDFDNISIEVLE